jgi:hypothetical protein
MLKEFPEEKILLGKFSEETLDHLLHQAAEIKYIGKRIDFLSGQFLGIDYKQSTMIGGMNKTEIFVLNLKEVDCFTFIDYVEAMRLSNSFSEFKENLKKVRYKSRAISFENRNHFFTDWRDFNPDFVSDVTEKIGGEKTIKIQKIINEKENGTYFLGGIKPVQREIHYIPSDTINLSVLDKFRTGDYIGIYSHMKGLDVSHAGIIIKDRDNIYLRHASSREEYRKVIDQDFNAYISEKPGIIVLRPKVTSTF